MISEMHFEYGEVHIYRRKEHFIQMIVIIIFSDNDDKKLFAFATEYLYQSYLKSS